MKSLLFLLAAIAISAVVWLLWRLLGEWMWPLMLITSLGMLLPRVHPKFGNRGRRKP